MLLVLRRDRFHARPRGVAPSKGMPMTWNWYITIEATRQYMDLAGLSGPLEARESCIRSRRTIARRAETDGPPGRHPADAIRR